MKRNYQAEIGVDEKKVARAMLKNRPVSLKWTTEFCRELKNRTVKDAESLLHDVIDKKRFLPLRKYTMKVPHRRGNAIHKAKAGKYPKNASEALLELLHNLKANADYKGLDSGKLIIRHMFASTGFQRVTFQPQGRTSGKRRKKKSAHIEVIAVEGS